MEHLAVPLTIGMSISFQNALPIRAATVRERVTRWLSPRRRRGTRSLTVAARMGLRFHLPGRANMSDSPESNASTGTFRALF
ncbi:MAG: hypothetical protein COS65_12610, partial [Armatimonadetes bacterium CG06_land_8_20_14_3_00_66_21]